MSTGPKVCVVGSVNMDIVVRCQRLPKPGETLLGSSYKAFPGGKGANQAVAAARLGARVSFVGAVGDDAHGRELYKTLEGEAIDLSHLFVRSGRASGLAMITVAEGGENTIIVAPGANATLTADEVSLARSAIEGSDVLLMQLETPTSAVLAAAKIASDAGKPVILNAAPARAIPAELSRLLSVLIVNRTEAGILGGLDPSVEPSRLALRLAESGPTAVVLTLGSQGAVVAYRNRPKRVGSFTVQAVDSVGAGDAFAGALAFGWPAVHAAFKARSPDEFALLDLALAMASAAGALATTRAGAIPSLPHKAEVDALVAQHVGSLS